MTEQQPELGPEYMPHPIPVAWGLAVAGGTVRLQFMHGAGVGIYFLAPQDIPALAQALTEAGAQAQAQAHGGLIVPGEGGLVLP